MAVGSKPESNILEKLNLELTDRGHIKIDKNNQTSNPKIFAGGDLAGAKGTVAWASRSGRNADIYRRYSKYQECDGNQERDNHKYCVHK